MADAETPARLTGELTAAPRGAVGTTLMALSGMALLRAGLRLAGRLALAYRHPAELRLSERGIEISHRTELLGKVLSDRETLIPLSNLSSITREVRFARLGLYAGLLALVLGTYVGFGLLIDGTRVAGGSPSLLGMGLGAIALGIGLDYVLSVVVDAVRKTCRIVVVPQHGPHLCMEGLDPGDADRVLSRIAAALGPVAPKAPPAEPRSDEASESGSNAAEA
jgi:hypothetical protein